MVKIYDVFFDALLETFEINVIIKEVNAVQRLVF